MDSTSLDSESQDSEEEQPTTPIEAFEEDDVLAEDTIKVLVASDCHLGYKHAKTEGYQVDDTFVTFEEILKKAQKYEVDMIILGGDLFHHSRPSIEVVTKCVELIRKYCLGNRKPKIELQNDPSFTLKHCSFKNVNYEESNLNVSIPIFTIHGNHDDPSFGQFGMMDVLAATGLVNYICKVTDPMDITISPLIFKRGNSRIALYGLSYINDQRLSRCLRDGRLKMMRPDNIENCFNILVLHQNRVAHSTYGYIADHKWPHFLNLLIWGHEHECQIDPLLIPSTGYYVCQPGSSVATSLCESEAVPKHVGLLNINQHRFFIEKLRLKTVRPYVFETISLKKFPIPRSLPGSTCNKLRELVLKYIENTVLAKATEQLTGHPEQPTKPLIRLRVLYERKEDIFETHNLGSKYQHLVANASEMIVFRNESTFQKHTDTDKRAKRTYDQEEFEEILKTSHEPWKMSILGNIQEYFNNSEQKEELTVLSLEVLNQTFSKFVAEDDSTLFTELIRHKKNGVLNYLDKANNLTVPEIVDTIKVFRRQQRNDSDAVNQTMISVSPSGSSFVNPDARAIPVDEDSFVENEIMDHSGRGSTLKGSRGAGSKGTRGIKGATGPRGTRGTRGTRGARGSRGRGEATRGREKVNPLIIDIDSE